MAGVRVGIDIGGTFTDLVSQNRQGEVCRVKVLTTPDDPAQGALEATRRFLQEERINPRSVQVVIHATTLASNALLTHKVSKTALITTEGFRDVLEIGRQNRPELYNLQVERIPPLVPRRYRFEVRERITYDGRVLQHLDREQASNVVRRIRQHGMESVAVCFLHSYANSVHERAVGQIMRRLCPGIHVSLSSDLVPEFREYERMSTTVVNACLQPLIARYLASLAAGLRHLKVRAPLFMMQSNGGTVLAKEAKAEPARIIESGPVAGAVASKAYGRKIGATEIISLDVGGTTSKAGVWLGEQFEVTTEYEVGGRFHGHRPVQGSGYPVKFPVVDLVEVGIGGGSLARVDDALVLHVGPKSAGASPGPACYGLGGTEPTLSDANIVLGRLNPRHLLGGELRLRPELALKAIGERVARPMGLGLTGAAVGILRIALANISAALKAATVERGRDPRGMTLVAFGGAGPMHACEVALQLEIKRVAVPPAAGLFSSLGLLLAEHVHDFVRTVMSPMSNLDYRALESTFVEIEERAEDLLRAEGVAERSIVFQRFFDMRYEGQSYELSVPVAWKRLDRRLAERVTRNFHRLHEKRYGYYDPGLAVELVNVRSYGRGPASDRIPKPPSTSSARSSNFRKVIVGGRIVGRCPVFDRREMRPGLTGRGPCIVEDYDSTIVIPSATRYKIDSTGTVIVSL